MRRILFIALCLCACALYATEFTPAYAPAATMQSVNNASYMSSGSSYTSTVYEVGSYSPSAAPERAIRKAPPGTGGESTYDPTNPQFAPIGDAVIPLLLCAILYTLWVVKRKKVS